MDPIRFAITRPVTITVCVLVVIMFGLIGVTSIPIQLTPTVDRPVITVTTAWPGRSPEQIVDEIAREQEKRLKNVTNLKTMYATAREGACEITLEFYVGTDLTRALQETSDSLRQVPAYPEEVDEPLIKTAEGAVETAIAWIIIDLDPAKASQHPGYDITTLYDAMDREVKPIIERIDGVAEVNIYGGREREVRVLVDSLLLAQRGLSHAQVVDALRRENRDVSAGSVPEGKRDFRVRLVGQFRTAQDVLDTIIAYREGGPVYVRDVAKVEMGNVRARGFVRSMGTPCLAMNIIRQSGSNVMSIMDQVRPRLAEIQSEVMPRLEPSVGPDLRIRQVYDETVYIQSAIDLVIGNLWKGGTLAVLVLLVFLRSFRSTMIIALAIPICVIATFLVMLAAGRTLNVVSLAGLAFATGVVVDNAVVVLENIDRRRAMGDSPLTAVYRGAREVWTAILGSTLTTVAVFVPILTVQEEVGQLFFDLSLALAVSVSLSLAVAVLVVPSAAGLFARREEAAGDPPRPARGIATLWGLTGLLSRGLARLADALHWAMTGWRGWTIRPAVILLLTTLSIWGSWALMPPLDYLPAGNQNLVFGGMLIPPGLSQDQLNDYADGIDAKMGPYLSEGKTPEQIAALPPIAPPWGGPPTAPVGVRNFFVGAFDGGMFAGAISDDPNRVIPVGTLLTGAMNGMPDAFGGASQASIFGQGIGGGNDIKVEISGTDLKRVLAAASMCYGLAGTKYGFGSNVQPNPANFDKLQPEWRLRLNDQGRQLGLKTEDLAIPVRALVDGAFAGEFRLDDRNVDLVVLPAGGRLEYKERLAETPVRTPSGRVVPMSVVADVIPAQAPQQISRIEELPSVTLNITPPKGRAIEELMQEIEAEVIGPARAAGLIDPTMRVRMEGTAAKLDQVRAALLGAKPSGPPARWQRGLEVASWIIMALGLAGAGLAGYKSVRRRTGRTGYAIVGVILLTLVIAGTLLGTAWHPQLVMARFIWALLVTYFVMCSLFESFLSPLVIMFSVPLGTVGAFASLRLVHEWTKLNPDIAPQQLDTLTMIGFVILIGTVVNNAILIVEQSLNFMHPERFGFKDEPLPPMRAIATSVRTRVRPIFMTTLTTLAGGLPLVIAPGAGSEIYRGLGAVTVGGLFVSTVFTLLLVPMAYSLVVDMQDAVGRAFAPRAAAVPARPIPAPVVATGSNGTSD
jgi:hydrophobic/amphiphilic exporter-1 (mainly G- bacteria), HAE1 family